MSKSKLWTVVRHEYLTIVKQPAFLISLLALPVIMSGVIGLNYLGSRTATSTIEEAMKEVDNIAVVDQSGLINRDVAEDHGLEVRDVTAGAVIEDVKTGGLNGAIVYPADLAETREFEVYSASSDFFVVPQAMEDIGEKLLSDSLLLPLGDPLLAELVTEGAGANITTFRDGQVSAGFGDYVVPGAFLAFFLIILFFSMGYMLLGVAEEKENRSMEMVLSYLKPRTLITGKLLGVSLVAFTQLAFFAVLGAAVLLVSNLYGERLGLFFSIDFANVTFDAASIVIGLAVLVLGFLLFAALMSGAASMAPGVKEANSFSGVFFFLPFVPFMLFGAIATAPGSAFVKFLTLFPVTSPTTLLLRNVVDNIGVVEAAIAIVVLALFTFVAFLMAAKLFRVGALEYADRVKISSLFK